MGEKIIKSKDRSKEKIILISIVGICVVVLGILAFVASNKSLLGKTDVKIEDSFEIKGEEPIKFKGISIVSKEHKVLVDKTLGDINNVKVSDKQHVSKGDVLFDYNNENLADQVDKLDRQISSNNQKKDRSNSNKSEYQVEIKSLENKLNDINSKIESLSSSVDSSEPSVLAEEMKKLEGSKMEISQGIEGYKSRISAEDSTIVAISDAVSELVSEKDALKEKVSTEVKADIDGIVYIDEAGIDNPTVPYMRVISEEALVEGQVSEYDINKLSVGDKVLIKINSNGEYIDGKIESIDSLPSTANSIPTATETSSSYNFYVKPDKSIMIGFGVEIKMNADQINIPSEYVYEEDSKIYVAKVKEDGVTTQKVEIKAVLSDDKSKYSLLDGVVSVGDKLVKNPKDVLEDGTK